MKKRFLQGISPAFLLLTGHQLSMARFEMMAMLLIMAICAALQTFEPANAQMSPTPPVSAPHTTEAAVSKAAVVTSTALKLPVEAVPAAHADNASPSPSPWCQSNTAYSPAPTPVNLGAYGAGLHIEDEGTYYYAVYGSTASQLRTEMNRCGPTGDFASQAAYTIDWSYALGADDSGQCRVVFAQVGVRTGILMPSYTALAGDSVSLESAWRAFVNGLRIHEAGHVVLAKQYGAQMLADLQTVPAGDCYTMGPQVEAMARNDAHQLDAAQVQYDADTHHGATQGAVF